MESRLAIVTFFEPGERPDYPSNALPGGGANWGGRPDNSLPGYGHISTLPVFPFDPTLKPDNSLPGGKPPHVSTGPIVPGQRFIVKWLCGQGLILVPDNELPETPEPK